MTQVPLSNLEYSFLFAASIGLTAGPLIIFRAFLEWRQLRLERISVGAIAQIKPGPVRLLGTARARSNQISPISGTSCCCWHVVATPIGRYSGDTRRITSNESFILDDSTGQAEVRPLEALWMELPRSVTILTADDERLQTLKKQNGFKLGHSPTNRYQVIEYFIPDGHRLIVSGWLTTKNNTPVVSAEERDAIILRNAEPTPELAQKGVIPISASLLIGSVLSVFGAWQLAQAQMIVYAVLFVIVGGLCASTMAKPNLEV